MSDKSPFPKTVKAGVPRLSNLPAGWAKAPLKAFLTEVKRPAKIKSGDLYNLITVKRARGGVEHRSQLLGREILVKSQFFVKTGDFVISKRQIVHGACGLVQAEQDGAIVSNEYVVFNAKENFDLSFLQYLSESLYFQQTCFHSSIGVHIEKMLFKTEKWLDWPFNIPPLPEQIKIAEILSTWDNAINTVQKLLANSQQQKKALMQQLLTGKKRFAGFEGEWEDTKLDDLFSFKRGKGLSKDELFSTGKYKCVLYGELYTKYDEVIKTVISRTNATESVKSIFGDILIPSSTTTTGIDLAKAVAILEDDVFLGGDINILRRKNSSLCSVFMAYLLTHIKKYEIAAYAQGITIIHLYGSDIKKIRVSIPSLPEQQKIAAVLTTADQEIDNLRAQLSRLEKEKKALMQQLLTGKRRVKVEEAA